MLSKNAVPALDVMDLRDEVEDYRLDDVLPSNPRFAALLETHAAPRVMVTATCRYLDALFTEEWLSSTLLVVRVSSSEYRRLAALGGCDPGLFFDYRDPYQLYLDWDSICVPAGLLSKRLINGLDGKPTAMACIAGGRLLIGSFCLSDFTVDTLLGSSRADRVPVFKQPMSGKRRTLAPGATIRAPIGCEGRKCRALDVVAAPDVCPKVARDITRLPLEKGGAAAADLARAFLPVAQLVARGRAAMIISHGGVAFPGLIPVEQKPIPILFLSVPNAMQEEIEAWHQFYWKQVQEDFYGFKRAMQDYPVPALASMYRSYHIDPYPVCGIEHFHTMFVVVRCGRHVSIELFNRG
ncbi:MAG: hypothetical protein JWR21_3572 [Herminiimonas sp.]|nr:hypothetical protein [Herminiimonas sp.]